jgi:hypothetical protein
MFSLVEKLKTIKTYIGIADYNINEQINTISICFKCSKEECLRLSHYDFSTLLDEYGNSISIKIHHSSTIIKVLISQNTYSLSEVAYDMEDLVESTHISVFDAEIIIDKNAFVQKTLPGLIDTYNVKLFLNFANFLKHFENSSLLELEKNLFHKQKKFILLIMSESVILQNEYTLILGNRNRDYILNYINNRFNSNLPLHQDRSIIEMRNENCYWVESTTWLLPDHLYFDFSSDEFIYTSDIKNFFHGKSTNILMSFIANYTNKETQLTFSNINGYKKISVEYKKLIDYSNDNVKYLYKQYKWSYGHNYSDKLGMLRNIISLYLADLPDRDYYSLWLDKSYEIYTSVLSNFDIYLKNNVEKYFGERHKIREVLNKKSKDILTEISSLLDTMNKNFLTAIGAVAAAIVGYLPKGNLNIVKLSVAVYIAYLVMSTSYYFPYYWFKMNIIIEDYNEHIVTFKTILIEKDIPKNTLMKKNKDKFLLYWWVSLLVTIIIICTAAYSLIYTREVIDLLKSMLS